MMNRKEQIDKLFGKPMKANQLQINRLRRRFVEYLNTPEWSLVKNKYTEVINGSPDVFNDQVKPEKLRRFAHNDGYNRNGKNFNSSPAVLNALADYLSSPDIDFLWIDEIEKLEIKASQLPFRLSEFFGFLDMEEFNRYSGEYLSIDTNDLSKSIIELSISNLNDKKLPAFQVSTVEFESKIEREGWINDKRISPPPLIYVGWGSLTDEDIFIAVMRPYGYESSCIFATVSIPERNDINEITLLNLVRNGDYDSLYEHTENGIHSVKEISENHYTFQRVGDFSCHSHENMTNVEEDDCSVKEQQNTIIKALKSKTRFSRSKSYQKDLVLKVKGVKVMAELTQDQQLLGKRLVSAALRLRLDVVRKLIEEGAPINYIHQPSGATAMHFLAGHCREEMVDLLLETGKCDLLIRDSQGRLPSGCAAELWGNMKLHGKLMELELAQAEERGLTYNDLYGPSKNQNNLDYDL